MMSEGLDHSKKERQGLGGDLRDKDREAQGECIRVVVVVGTVHFQAHWRPMGVRHLERCPRQSIWDTGHPQAKPTGTKLILDSQTLGSQPFPQRAMSSSLRYVRNLQNRQ